MLEIYFQNLEDNYKINVDLMGFMTMLKKVILGLSLLVLPVASNAITLSKGFVCTGLTGIMLRSFKSEAMQKTSDIFLNASIAYFAIICVKSLLNLKPKQILDEQLDKDKVE